MIDEVEFRNWFQRVVDRSGSRIQDSKVFMSIFTEDFKKNPQCALELGIAIMLDKPIALLVTKDTKITNYLRKYAAAIEYLQSEDKAEVQRAGASLMRKMQELQ